MKDPPHVDLGRLRLQSQDLLLTGRWKYSWLFITWRVWGTYTSRHFVATTYTNLEHYFYSELPTSGTLRRSHILFGLDVADDIVGGGICIVLADSH